MSFVITCPNAGCARPLRLPADAVGKPLSCPHCRAAIAVALGPDGQPTAPALVPTARRVPPRFLVPAFSLVILGLAGTFANGYLATDAFTRPGAAYEHARRMVDYLRDADGAGRPAEQARGKGEADPREAFAAVLGQAARVATDEELDRQRAEAAAGWVGPVCAAFGGVSVLMAGGGLAMLFGRWYWLAVAGSVAALVNVNLCCCVPGLVAGLWGVLTLARDDARKSFGL